MTNVYHHHIEWAKTDVPPFAARRTLFAADEKDDAWMHFVGRRGWVVFGQDYRWHREQVVLEAIRQHAVRAFYLWGAEAPKWDAIRSFARGYAAIIARAQSAGPFIYRVGETGRLRNIALPNSARAKVSPAS